MAYPSAPSSRSSAWSNVAHASWSPPSNGRWSQQPESGYHGYHHLPRAEHARYSSHWFYPRVVEQRFQAMNDYMRRRDSRTHMPHAAPAMPGRDEQNYARFTPQSPGNDPPRSRPFWRHAPPEDDRPWRMFNMYNTRIRPEAGCWLSWKRTANREPPEARAQPHPRDAHPARTSPENHSSSSASRSTPSKHRPSDSSSGRPQEEPVRVFAVPDPTSSRYVVNVTVDPEYPPHDYPARDYPPAQHVHTSARAPAHTAAVNLQRIPSAPRNSASSSRVRPTPPAHVRSTSARVKQTKPVAPAAPKRVSFTPETKKESTGGGRMELVRNALSGRWAVPASLSKLPKSPSQSSLASSSGMASDVAVVGVGQRDGDPVGEHSRPAKRSSNEHKTLSRTRDS